LSIYCIELRRYTLNNVSLIASVKQNESQRQRDERRRAKNYY